MYEYDSRVRLTEVDPDRNMSLMGILNAFQDCSTFHSEDLGVGMDYLERRDRMWVLRSWKIVILHRPALAERIRVGTWPYEFGKMTGKRNFRLLDQEGELAAYADTTWVLMDTRRMRPALVDEEFLRAYQMEPAFPGSGEDSRIPVPEETQEREPFRIRAWHLDVNRHVNNGQYVQLAGEYLPEGFPIRQMRAEYFRSAVLGDRIRPRIGACENGYTVILGSDSGKPYAAVEFRQERE